MSYKGIKGAQIKASGGKPSTNVGGVVGKVSHTSNVKGGPNLGGLGKEGFFMGKSASGPKTVIEARGKHLA